MKKTSTGKLNTFLSILLAASLSLGAAMPAYAQSAGNAAYETADDGASEMAEAAGSDAGTDSAEVQSAESGDRSGGSEETGDGTVTGIASESGDAGTSAQAETSDSDNSGTEDDRSRGAAADDADLPAETGESSLSETVSGEAESETGEILAQDTAVIPGTPYRLQDEAQVYDVTVPHVVINQVYTSAKGSYASHGFIELYNPTEADIDLTGWSVQYRSSADGDQAEAWVMQTLSGTIPAGGSYLIRCAAVKSPSTGALQITDYDLSWDQAIYNKGISVLLIARATLTEADQAIYTTDSSSGESIPAIAGYVDLYAVAGNDETEEEVPPFAEAGTSPVQSKKKTLRRIAFADTDDNTLRGDMMTVDYSFGNADYIAWIAPRSSADGAWKAEDAPTYTVIFETNGGSTIEPAAYAYNTSPEAPMDPVKEGETFAGWYTDEDLTAAYGFDTLPTGDLTLYAAWGEGAGTAYEAGIVTRVYVTTADGNGNALVKSDGYVSASLVVVETDGTVHEDASGNIKVRGNSTAEGAKKPFNIKFSSKVSISGMEASKKWCLLANCFDPTLIRNYIALELADTMGIAYTSEHEFAELWLDGVYKGCYLLTEAVEAASGRVEISTSDGDFMVERNTGRHEDGVTYVTSADGIRFEVSEPEEPASDQLNHIQTVLDNFEEALDSGDYDSVTALIDEQSFVNYYVFSEYLKVMDFSAYSVNLYYQDGLLHAGPAWDYDMSTGNIGSDYMPSYYNSGGNSWEGVFCNSWWFGKLLSYSEFYTKVKSALETYSSSISAIYSEGGMIDQLMSDYGEIFDLNYSEAGWSVGTRYSAMERQPEDTYEANVEYLRTWLENRLAWLTAYYEDGVTVRLYPQNGKNSSAKYLMVGDTFGTLPTPSKKGAVFLGWYTEKEGGELVTEDTVCTGKTYLYAHWLTGAEAFVTRLYQVCLDRDPDSAGLTSWVRQLESGSKTGAQVAEGFIFSSEFKKKNLCNTHYVYYLYQALLSRSHDDGAKTWISMLDHGISRETVFDGFIGSSEFKSLCALYDIEPGSKTNKSSVSSLPTGPCSVCGESDGVVQFVMRLYQKCLGRSYDSAGLASWVTKLRTGQKNGTQVAEGFFFSNEFLKKGLSDEAYIDCLYQVILGRAADPAGKASWMARLAGGMSRKALLEGFTGSQEFIKLCGSYGISAK